MRNEKDEKLDQLIRNELLNDLGLDEQKILSRIEFTEKPLYKKPLFFIPTLVCTLLILITVVSFVSISIYKNTYQPQYGDNDIVYEALEAFEDEVEGFDLMKRMNLYQVDHDFLCSFYFCKDIAKYHMICYQKNLDFDKMVVNFNNKEYFVTSKVFVLEITLEDSNELIIYENDVEIFKTTFKK